MLSAARYLSPGPGAVVSRSDTSSTLKTTGSFRGRDQQRAFEEEGVDLSRVVIGHPGDYKDLDYLRELVQWSYQRALQSLSKRRREAIAAPPQIALHSVCGRRPVNLQ